MGRPGRYHAGMVRVVAVSASLLVSCAASVGGDERPAADAGKTAMKESPVDAGKPADPAAKPAEPPPTQPRTEEPAVPEATSTFVDLRIPLAPGMVQVADDRREDPSPIPGGAPSVEYFRSFGDGGDPFLFVFTWDGFPARDRGPMKAITSWKLAGAEVEFTVTHASMFFGRAQEVLVAHFPGLDGQRYMIYTTRVDRPAFEALLRGIHVARRR